MDRSLAQRASEVRVEAIVHESAEVDGWKRSLDAMPVVRDLREHFERVRLEELERALGNASGEERARADRLTRALVNRLLHLPTVRLKDVDPASDEGASRLRAARELFALGVGPWIMSTDTERLRVGTRASRLALADQSRHQSARASWPGLRVERVPITTLGDRVTTVALSRIGDRACSRASWRTDSAAARSTWPSTA